MIEIRVEKEKKSNYHKHWNYCVGAGRAHEGLYANWQEQLKFVVDECGFKYIRFHGIFHDDMFVYKELEGREMYNWYYIDELYDRLLKIGIRPFVELAFCPSDMASGTQTQFWWKTNVTPPKDYGKWARLVRRTVEHWIERYGIEEVRKWYFEVWNEPNLKAFWNGTKSQYFELYKITAETLKEIDYKLKVGGPATSNFVPDDRFKGETEDVTKHKTFSAEIKMAEWKGVWIEDFLDFCESKSIPVDFISTHPYPTDFAFDDGKKTLRGYTRELDATVKDLKWINKILKNTRFKNLEVHLTEWNSSPSSRDCTHDYLPAATYVLRTNIETIGLATSLSYWTFTDIFEEQGAGSSIFHGGFGLLNFYGIPKPTFHVYKFLNRLGGYLLSKGDWYIATIDENNKLKMIVYNFPKEYTQTVPISPYPNRSIIEEVEKIGAEEEFNITIRGEKPINQLKIEVLDRENGNAIYEWQKMGCREYLTQNEINALKERALKTQVHFVNLDNKQRFFLKLQSWAIALIEEI